MFCFHLACCRVLARDSGPESQAGFRSEIIDLVRSKYETLRPPFGKSKGSSKSIALVGKGGIGYGGKGGKAHGKGKGGSGNACSNGGAGKAKVPVMRRAFQRKAAGHYSDSCTAKLRERCGGRGHESSRCASPADIDESLAEAVLAMMGDPGDDAPETTSF